MSYVRAAVAANLPPKQVIFNDPKHTSYDFWDLRLLKAYHFAQDFIRDGIPVWWDENDDVFFEAEGRISKSKAAVQRKEKAETGKDKTPPDGRYYIPIPKTRGGAPMPSFSDWLAQLDRKKAR